MVEEPWFGFGTLLDVADSLMENLPGQAACAMCDGPNGGLITQDATADAGTPPESMCSSFPEHSRGHFVHACAGSINGAE
jgi:hypothetical protein